MRMRRTAVVGPAVVITLAGAWRPGAEANGQPKKNRGCSNATIEGTHSIQISGTAPSSPGGPIESVIGVVIRHYDGQGQFHPGRQRERLDQRDGAGSTGFGTYQVNEDCSGVARFQPAPAVLLEDLLVIVDDGIEISERVPTRADRTLSRGSRD